MMNNIHDKVFLDADQEVVEYDGSEIKWRVSAYAVIKKEDRIFIIKDKREKLYDIVGGGIEFGEDTNQALIRESLEEGGVKIDIGKILYSHVNWFYHKKQKAFYQTMRLFFRAELVGKITKPLEENIEFVGFVPIKDIGSKYRLPDIVEKIILEQF